MSNTKHKFLIDTGASVSLCQPHVAVNKSQISNTNPIAITGINSEPFLLNEIYTIKPIANCDLMHDLYILPENNNVKFDGIFGLDFIKKYEMAINFINKELVCPYKKIPLLCDNELNKVTSSQETKTCPEQKINLIPSRNIYTVQLTCDKPPGFYFCPKTNIGNYLTLPESIVKVDENKKFITTILNTSENDEILQNFDLDLEHFDINTINNISMYNNNDNCNSNFPSPDRINKVKENLRTSHLNQEEEHLITSLCLKYADIFHLEGDKLTFTSKVKHDIITTTNVPISSKSYRYPEVHKEEVKSQIEKLLEQKIIQPSCSPWSSPVWIVSKKVTLPEKQNGGW